MLGSSSLIVSLLKKRMKSPGMLSALGDSRGLNENGPPRLMGLNTWSPVDGTA